MKKSRNKKRPAGSGPGGRRAREARAEELIRKVRASLPEAVREASSGVAVRLEAGVPERWLRDGVEPDSLGLFSGPSLRDPDAGQADEAPLVSLFLDNLWEWSDGDQDIFEGEVVRTFLHELGHFLGLEEDDMAARDLD